MDRAGLSWPSAGSVDCLLCFIRSIALFSHRHVLMIFYLHLLTRFFSKKRCEHMPSSFRVNNLLHQNLLNYSIFLDSKTTKKSKLNFPVSMTGTSLTRLADVISLHYFYRSCHDLPVPWLRKIVWHFLRTVCHVTIICLLCLSFLIKLILLSRGSSMSFLGS
jgi:hypothetical protein